jgi:hypothetical protein
LGKEANRLYYLPEIIHTDYNPDAAFDVEKIIRTVGRGKKKKHLVKYLHYGKEHNEWYVTS